MEVVYSLADLYGYNLESIEAVRVDKEKRNGGFKKKVYLISVDREEYRQAGKSKCLSGCISHRKRLLFMTTGYC